MNKRNIWFKRAVSVLTGRRFWWFIVGLLVLQAAWIALSGRYPMAFDEDFHLGIIRLYSHHLSPFWSNQPESADMFGAVARDPSYLYQYLMSFLYRFITVFTSDQAIIVLIFRFVSIGLFAWGLTLFRKLLLKTGVSRAVVHTSLLILVLLPVTPLLAAQINYDNLLMPLVALALLMTVRFGNELRTHKKLNSALLLQILVLCLITSLVKYAFLPIFIAIVVFIVFCLWLERRQLNLRTAALASWRRLGHWTQVGLLAGLIIAAGLFYQRFGVNFIRYHSPVPDCSKVLNVETCSEYGPWIRDYNLELNKVPGNHNAVTYTREWFYGMWLRIFFAVSGPVNDFESRGPLALPGIGAIVFAILGTLALVVTFKQLLRRYQASVIWLFVLVTVVYVGFLWLDEFRAYLHTGQPVAINGRYLLPVLPLVLLLFSAAVNQLTRHWRDLQIGLTAICIICLAWGGGFLTFVLRSDDAWYWQNGIVRTANDDLRKVLGPATPGYRQPTKFLH